jgi:hypothetical protein
MKFYKQIKKYTQMGLSKVQLIRIISAYKFERYRLTGMYNPHVANIMPPPEVEYKTRYTHLESHIILLPFIGKRVNILARKTWLMFKQSAYPDNGSVVTYEERFIGEHEGSR